MGLSQIKHAIRLLPLTQLRKLDEWLHEWIARTEEAKRTERPSLRKQTVAERALDNKTYRLEGTRCGKDNFKCTRGKLHGPYWYAYWSENGTTKSQYVGKKLAEKKGRKATVFE